VTLYLRSKPIRHESGAQERSNDRKAEAKQDGRLLAILSKKLVPAIDRPRGDLEKIAKSCQ
jgi:hypothetical protein